MDLVLCLLVTFLYILFVVALLVVTWATVYEVAEEQCFNNPAITCHNDWKCNTVCTDQDVHDCFKDTTYTTSNGLAECLLGVTSDKSIVNACKTIANNGGSCNCDVTGISLSNDASCLNGCPLSLSSVQGCPVDPSAS